ncbi:unnamed protein product, partial [Meganyctiphanes norvegica]
VLSEFSKQLMFITKGHVSLRDVTIVLPRMWEDDDLLCTLDSPVTISAVSTTAHIRISTPHPVFESRPWTQQSQGCGKQGDFIQLGSDMLKAKTNESYAKSAHLLLAEWAKFRWGIFNEHGFDGDSRYPATYHNPKTNEIIPNTCFPNGSNAPFCDVDYHTPEAPNKHNSLCKGKAAWDVIMQSQDFVDKRDIQSEIYEPLIPVFHFVKPGQPRVILLVEDTAVMNLQNRWEFIRKSVRRAVVYDMPDGAHVGIVVFNSEARTTASLAKMDPVSDVRQRIGSSMPRNPSRIPEKHKCLLCGFQEALRALESDYSKSEGATIILITTGAGSTPQQELDEIIHLAASRKLHIELILYPFIQQSGEATPNHGLDKLIHATHGSAVTVMDEGVGNDSKVTMMVSLMDALLSAIRRLNTISEHKAPRVVHSQAYPGSLTTMSRGTFDIDDSLGPDAKFSIYYYDLDHVGNTIQLTTPSGNTMSSLNMQEEDGDANVIFMNILMAERGTWSYKVENRAGSHQALVMQVTAHESVNRDVSLRIWTSINNSTNTTTVVSDPVIVYAELKNGVMPILNARLVAKLQRLGTDVSGNEYLPVYVDLFDNGYGDPDITGGDGVYTRYLPNLSHKTKDRIDYELSVTADYNNGKASTPVNNILTRNPRVLRGNENTCCGSTIQYEHVMPLSSFQRTEIYGILGLTSYINSKDIIPPGRILDLNVSCNETGNKIKLEWKAPGDDFDFGYADHYEAIFTTSWMEATTFHGTPITDLPVPAKAGKMQFSSTNAEYYDQTVYMAIRAVDEVGNLGDVSNIATIWIPSPPTTTPPATTMPAVLPPNHLAESLGQGVTQPVRLGGLEFEDMVVVIGSVAGFLLIVAIFATFCFLHVARRQSQHHKKNQEKTEANREVIIRTNSTRMLDQSKDNTNNTVKHVEKEGPVLSPNPSWSPSKLLREHERRYSVDSVHSVHSIVSREIMEASESLVPYQNLHDPYPDVTLIGSHSYPSSQASDPPAYQPSYTADNSMPYPYSYNYEEIPNYAQATPSRSRIASQSSQCSAAHPAPRPSRSRFESQATECSGVYPSSSRTRVTSLSSQCFSDYDNDVFVAPSEMSYPQEIQVLPNGLPKYAEDLPGYLLTPTQIYSNNMKHEDCHSAEISRTRAPPVVAPKPCLVNRTPVDDRIVEPMRRSITQV